MAKLGQSPIKPLRMYHRQAVSYKLISTEGNSPERLAASDLGLQLANAGRNLNDGFGDSLAIDIAEVYRRSSNQLCIAINPSKGGDLCETRYNSAQVFCVVQDGPRFFLLDRVELRLIYSRPVTN